MRHTQLTTNIIMQKLFIFSCALIIVFSVGTSQVFAQLELGLREGDVSVLLSPEIPKPNQTVMITLSSFSINIDTLMIIWKKDGATLKTGLGVKSISVESPNIGESITVTAEIFSKGASIKKTVFIRPSEIDLLWEATDSYVPPFYKGKALPGSEGAIQIVAIPNTGSLGIKGSDLVYTWRKNFTAVPSLSGYGKQSITTRLGYLNPSELIEVEVKNVSGTYKATDRVTITPIKPKILYYEIDPMLGLLTNKAIESGHTIAQASFELFASPFFFSVKDLASNELIYKWVVGGKSVPSGAIKNRITLQFEEKAAGSTQVTTDIDSAAKIFQRANASIGINKR